MNRNHVVRWSAVLLLVAIVPAAARALTVADEAAVRAVVERYRTAWLANSPAAVLATFAADGVLLAPGTPAPIAGTAAIRSYWWPPGPPVEITGFTLVVDGIDGEGDLAFVRGHDRVEWRTRAADGTWTAATSRSRFSTVLRRQGDRWAIQLQSWFALPAD